MDSSTSSTTYNRVPADQPEVAEAAADKEGYFRVSDEERERRERIKEALRSEGFRWEIWQKPERDMVFGMIRTEGDMQVHVRYYRDGVVRAETEIAHHFFEHLVSPRESAHHLVQEILEKHGIDDVQVQEKEFPDRMKGDMPGSRTRWKPVVAAAGAVLAGAVLGARTLLRRD